MAVGENVELPPTDRRISLRAKGRAAATSAAAASAALLLLGCGKSMPTLNTVRIERAVTQSILTQHHLHTTVSCPKRVPRKARFAFTCTARLSVGTYPVLVTETNASGHVRYENQAPLVSLDIAGVERAITQSILSQRRLQATVTCPAEVIQKAGIAFTCTAMVGGRAYPFAVTESDGDGHVRYVGLQQAGGSPPPSGESGG
jgi:hypothetical protein